MNKNEKVLQDVLSGKKDSNIKFSDLCKMLEYLGGECRIKGDHFIYSFVGYDENINIQPKGNLSKPYQIKQIRNFILNQDRK